MSHRLTGRVAVLITPLSVKQSEATITAMERKVTWIHLYMIYDIRTKKSKTQPFAYFMADIIATRN